MLVDQQPKAELAPHSTMVEAARISGFHVPALR